ncbi:glycosyl hydrolase family 95 catalytic domain-containing protein [Bifidobacterium bifidum]|uniref:glycosyl hydrolase family 95 catalytic domain-containing protein n=1 Tax=Bifidobacterium bifidum TaxID=1681 RepID=UPI001AEC0E10|nr:glycoside hydrolase N-terminal domain-containing protein [Bifidobacterium bifidum]QTQ17622.1 1 2-A-L-fucosidase [Bifidobacterium bifidum]
MKHRAMSSRLMPLVASCATVGMLLAGLPASAVAVGTTRAAASDASSSTTATITPSADTTLQTWTSEKNSSMASKPYIGTLQGASQGVFGEKFESTDAADTTDLKTGLLTFDLSAYDHAPDSATFEMTYLGYRGNPTATDTDTIKVTPVDTTVCTNNATDCGANVATGATKPKFSINDSSFVAESKPFEYGTTVYAGDAITVVPANTKKVTVDVTEIVRQQFAEGKKVITLAVGETKKTEVRFASSEGTTSLNGATADMAPKLTVSVSTKDDLKPSADTTLQAWASEKNEKKNTAAYVGALQPEGDYGDFGEKFKSTDVHDVTDAKMGLMTFDLSDYTAAPEHSILTLTYLGYAGADKTATATDKVKVVAVDTSRCTGTAPCDTNNATWANRPDFEVTDTTKTATSHAFAYGSKKYSDGMTVESGNAKKVLLDVTDIIKAEFAKFSAGATEKKITLALGELNKSDMRFGSKEVTSLTGATEAMQPTLSVTKKPKAYTLSIEGPTKVKYQKGEAFDKAGLVVKATSTADGTVKTLTEGNGEDNYTIDTSAFDSASIGVYPITVKYNKDPEIAASFNAYVIASVEDGGDGDTSKDDWLWYKQPASQTDATATAGGNYGNPDNNRWQQTTLPFGNGKIGGTVWGEVSRERVTFNEETLWTGGPGSSTSYNGGNNETKGQNGATLRALNKQLANGAETVNPGNLTGGENAAEQGNYLNWGDIYLDYGFNDTTVTEYRRDLNLSKGKADVTFKHDGVTYTREYFASNPDNVMVARLTASKAGKLNFNVSMPTNTNYSKTGETTTVKGDTLTVKGALGNNGLLYNSQIKVVLDNGEGTLSEGADGASLKVSDAKAVTLYIAAATDYKQKYPSYRTGETAAEVNTRVAKVVQDAANKGYTAVKKAHIADHSAIYDRVKIDLGQSGHSSDGAVATDALLKAYQRGSATTAQKRELETLVYKYGRYLTIGSSRENSQLPSNLQGIWSVTADDNAHGNTPWGSDFHMNVNLQMNYWPTYSANMGELAEPLIEYVEGLVKPGRVTAKVYAGAETTNPETTPIGEGEGYMAHTENTAYGWTAPGQSFSWGWSPAAVPWILQNVYEAYEYSGDPALLDRVYALLKEESHFYVNYMLHKAGSSSGDRLTTGVAYSPEQGPLGTDGNTYESSLVWQMLNDAIEAAKAKGDPDGLVGDTTDCSADNWAKGDNGNFTDANANRSWSCAKSLLKPIEVGNSGQIKEWYFEGALGKKKDGSAISGYQADNQHRHMSHLLGLFPGDLITIDNSEYMDAAKTSLRYRCFKGNVLQSNTGWAIGQRINSWARTGDGNTTYKLVELQLKNAMYANLFDYHAPFQIDGNFGNTSGVDEMLLQSNSTFTDTDGKKYVNYTNILPALPDAWADGSVSGLVARGNFTVGTTWKNGKATEVKLTSNKGKQAAVKITAGGAQNYEVKNGDTAVNAKVVTNADGASLLVFDTTAGTTYTITKKASANVPVTGVTVTGANTATAGDTVTLTATVAPADATDKSVTWSTSDAAVATVNANGVVTTKKAGKVTITATSNGDKTKFGSIEITVSAATVPVTSVTVAGDAAMTVDGEQTLTATVAPANATDKTVTWKSSDATVATVDANGKVVAKKAGEVTITATAGGVSGTLKITVSDKAPTVIPVRSVTVTGKQELVEGASTTLTATVAPADATDKTVTWKSSDESVATVDKDGVVTAKKAGTVTITATAGGVSGTLDITVTAKPVETVPVTSVEVTVEAGTTVSVGKTLQATATVKPGNATNKKVTWKSSDESIATVDANGVITAKKAGKVVITATSTDGTDKSGSVEITVADETKPTPDHKSVKADTGDVTAGKTGTVTEPKDVAGWKSRSIIKQGKLGKAEIADGTLVYAAGDKTGDDSFVVQYTMADGTVIDVTYSVTVKAAETGKNDGDGKGDGVAKTGAAVGALAGLGLMLLAVGVSVVMIRRKRSA